MVTDVRGKSKLPVSYFTSSSSWTESFQLVRLEYHKERSQAQGRKKRQGKDTQQLKLAPFVRPRESTAQDTKRIFRNDLRSQKSLIRVRVPFQIGGKINIQIQRPSSLVLISSKVLHMIIKLAQRLLLN